LAVAVDGLAADVDETGIRFRGLGAGGATALNYDKLLAFDAGGKTLPSRMEATTGGFAIVVDDSDASYPITIDPLLTTPAWQAESDQVDALFGWSVAGAGDVNGDGLADVIIGAPSFDNGEDGEGAAFLYLGSPTGLSPTPAWQGEIDQAGAAFGTAVAGAGDVNGDGYADVIVGASAFDNGQNAEGAAFLYLGGASGLAATPAWQVEGDQAISRFGNSLSGAGDVNGDGFADVIVGASLFDNGQTDEGAAFVYLGSASGLATTPAWQAEGSQASASFGFTVGSAGDVNGDGFADVIVGAPFFDNGQSNEGSAFVYLGSATGLAAPPAWQVESNQAAAVFGGAVAGAGDVNGDGFADVIVGARSFDSGQNSEGTAFVYLGGPTGLATTSAWQAESNQDFAALGLWVSGAGDVNGDGYADVLVGAPFFDNGQSNEGAAFLYLGSPTGPGTTPAWQAEGEQDGAEFGAALAGAGDVNGDGFADLLVGARSFDNGQSNEGAAFVYLGSAAGPATTEAWRAESNQSNAEFGWSVADAGDVNGDGYADVIVGAPSFDNGQTDEGAAFVYLGSAAGLAAIAAWQAEGDQTRAEFGYSVSGAGDVNGDGYADVIVGARLFSNGHIDEGAAFVYLGGATGLAITPVSQVESDQASALFGTSVSAAGDVNGDGLADVIVGAPFFNNGQVDVGAAFVFLGTPAGLSPAPAWQAEGDRDAAVFGNAVSGAGDVNGDGYDDVIVGANRYANGQNSEGAAFVYLGSVSGPGTTPSWQVEGNEFAANLGRSVSGAGDVNGDGFADVIVGIPFRSNRGAAQVYLGGANGLPTTPSQQITGSQGNAEFGASVSGAGDVNDDGYADVIIGASLFGSGQNNEGAAFIYLGTAMGLESVPVWRSESNQEFSDFADAVSAAGDVNGDGYADVIVGAARFDAGQSNEGAAFVYLGNEGLSRNARAQQFDGAGVTPIAPGGIAPGGSFRASVFAPVHVGRTMAGIAVELKPAGVPFDGTNLVTAIPQLVYQDSTTGEARYDATIQLPAVGAWQWRARLLSDPATTASSGVGNWGRWLRPQRSPDQGADVRFVRLSVGGTVLGLVGSGLVLRNNGGDDLLIAADGSFRFATALDDGTMYAVSVATQPTAPNQVCTVSNGNGTLNGAAVSDVQVVCVVAPELSISDVSQAEGNSGTSDFIFTVSLSAPALAGGVSFDIATADGSALAPDDYLANAATAQLIPEGQSTYSFTVSVIGDSLLEANEQFFVNLGNVSGANLVDGQGVGTILDEDTTTGILNNTPNPSVVGQPYTVTVEVSGGAASPAGTVTVSDGTDSCGPVALVAGPALTSSASCALSSTSIGSKTLTATYAPAGGAFAASSGTASQQVDPSSTLISVSGPPRSRINTPTPFDFTLTVNAPGGGTPTGTVTISSAGSSCQVSVPSASSSCDLSFDLLGPRTISASFTSSDGNHLASSSSGAGDAQTLVFALSDLVVSKTDTVDSYAEGDLLVYTITLRNLGPDRAENLRLRDQVPAGLVDVQWTCDSSGGASCPANFGSGDIDAQIPSYPVGALLNYSFYGNVLSNPEQILNTATLELPADETIEDGNLANNSASDLNLRNLLFADGFEAATVNAASGSFALPSAALHAVLDETARVVYLLDDAEGEAARVYARVFNGQLQYALAQRASGGLLRLGPWIGYADEPQLRWNASEQARGWVVQSVSLE
jgi:uncharacterized repeat protein (TIGR01451 family)